MGHNEAVRPQPVADIDLAVLNLVGSHAKEWPPATIKNNATGGHPMNGTDAPAT